MITTNEMWLATVLKSGRAVNECQPAVWSPRQKMQCFFRQGLHRNSCMISVYIGSITLSVCIILRVSGIDEARHIRHRSRLITGCHRRMREFPGVGLVLEQTLTSCVSVGWKASKMWINSGVVTSSVGIAIEYTESTAGTNIWNKMRVAFLTSYEGFRTCKRRENPVWETPAAVHWTQRWQVKYATWQRRHLDEGLKVMWLAVMEVSWTKCLHLQTYIKMPSLKAFLQVKYHCFFITRIIVVVLQTYPF